MKTVKREGGFETLLFGPDSTRHSRKNSALPTHDSNGTASSVGGKGTWTRVPESSSAGSGSSGGGAGIGSGGNGSGGVSTGLKGVHDVDTVPPSSSLPQPRPRPLHDADSTGHEGTAIDLKSSSRDSLSEYAEDSVMVSSEGSDVYTSAASLTLFDLTDIQDQDINYATVLGSEEGHDYMHPGQGPFSGKEPRRAVRFSENVEDNWEEICVDVTPFTTLSLPPHIDEEEREQHVTVSKDAIPVEDTVIPRPDTLSQSRQESFMMRQSDYAEVQKKAAVVERAAADKAAQLLASNAAAELVFCEAMSTTLSSGDSPLESESDKVSHKSYYPIRICKEIALIYSV